MGADTGDDVPDKVAPEHRQCRSSSAAAAEADGGSGRKKSEAGPAT
jgi:hypothetical protein